MKNLERENVPLKKLVVDLPLDKAILQEASKLNFCAPPVAARRGSRPNACGRHPFFNRLVGRYLGNIIH